MSEHAALMGTCIEGAVKCSFCLEIVHHATTLYHSKTKVALVCNRCTAEPDRHKRCPICDADEHEDALAAAAVEAAGAAVQ